ncbi:MAG TPA: hypothetical protein VGJ07_23010 [Rugosimonospora sp.]
MRRWLVAGAAPALVAGAVSALVAGCDTGTPRSAAGTAPSGAVAPAAPLTTAPAPISPSPDPTAADTRHVCAEINEAVAQGASTFGADLGLMTGHLAGGNQAAADAARKSAVRELTTLAGKVRTVAAPALNPAVRAAADTTASNLDQVAADPGLLTGVRTIIDVSPVLGRITSTAGPLTGVCV